MLETPEVNGARQALPCLESPEINGARQSVAVVEKYVDGAWQEVWRNIQPVEITKNKYLDGTVVATGNDIVINFGTNTQNNGIVNIDITGEWELPIITGTLTFDGGKYSDTYYYHENIRWTVVVNRADGTGTTYELPNSNGQHAYEYSTEVYLPITLEGTITSIKIAMVTGTYNDSDVAVQTAFLGLKIDDVPYGADITL